MRSSVFYIVVALFFAARGYGQILFTSVPQDFQMFPRNNKSFGLCRVSGIPSKDLTLRTILYDNRTGGVIQTITRSVKRGKIFHVEHHVPAKLAEYNLVIFAAFHGTNFRVIKQVRNLVAGDFFIVSGQSNAECGFSGSAAGHDSLYYQPANRAIGGNMSWSTAMLPDSTEQCPIVKDCRLSRPHSSYSADYFRAYSGLWPLKLQYELSKATGIPNCVINGSRGASPIQEHYASHTPSDPDSLFYSPDYRNQKPYSLYDRTYKKLYENDAVNHVKAIFWYQGETDGYGDRESALDYYNRFGKLYKSWVTDYPSLEKVFVVQLNMGCGDLNHSIIREMQRRLPRDYPKVVVVPAMGTSESDRLPDMCHYTLQGYDRIAEKLYAPALKLLYGSSATEEEVLSPDIENIYYFSKDRLCLEFNRPVTTEESRWYESEEQQVFLRDYFFDQGQNRINVKAVSSAGNKVFLDLADTAQTITYITYLPRAFTDIPSLYCGPYIRNAVNTDIPALSFLEFPVYVQPPEKLNDQASTFFVAPNPARDEIMISQPDSRAYQFTLYDIWGEVQAQGNTRSSKTSIPVSALQRGIYHLRLVQDQKVIIIKMVLY